MKDRDYPWKVTPARPGDGFRARIEDASGWSIAYTTGEQVQFADTRADNAARLIAAAPALAEALALVEGMLDNFPGFESCAYPLTDGPSANIGEIVRAALRAAGVIE